MENNCENCKFWGQIISKEFRRCLKSKMADSPMYSGCGLNTKKDFGCKLFEAKHDDFKYTFILNYDDETLKFERNIEFVPKIGEEIKIKDFVFKTDFKDYESFIITYIDKREIFILPI